MIYYFAAILKGTLLNIIQNIAGGVLNWPQIEKLHQEESSPRDLFYKAELDSEQLLEFKLAKQGKCNLN